MPLFKCDKCGCVENTACGEYWGRSIKGKPVLCSECSPLCGNKWHGRFPKEAADEAHGWYPDPRQPHFLEKRDVLPSTQTKGE